MKTQKRQSAVYRQGDVLLRKIETLHLLDGTDAFVVSRGLEERKDFHLIGLIKPASPFPIDLPSGRHRPVAKNQVGRTQVVGDKIQVAADGGVRMVPRRDQDYADCHPRNHRAIQNGPPEPAPKPRKFDD